MKNKTKILMVLIAVIVIVSVIIVVFIGKKNDNPKDNKNNNGEVFAKGVWWWSVSEPDEIYLEFLRKNGVNEIYYADSSFDSTVDNFINKANSLGIKVFFLCEEYQWIDDISSFNELLNEYTEYQNSYENKFSGVHIDVEPHQHPDWNDNNDVRIELIERYLNYVKLITTDAENDNISFDFDIPFWYDDYFVEFNGENKEAYKFVIDMADRVFVMSYRDSAERIYSSAENELEYASQKNKKLFLCVETSDQSAESENISFFEEGKNFMNGELETLKQIILDEYGEKFNGFGFSIHHMKSWYELKD